MQVLLTVAAILGLTALFSYINERFLQLQQTIGLMLLALGLMLVLMFLNAVLFVVIGLHIAIVPSIGLMPTATIAIIVCLAARWISVNLSLNALTLAGALKADRLGLTNLLTWGGLRGGLAVAMAMSLPDSPEKAVILHMTYGVVAFSIIVQGLSISRIFSAEQLKRLLS